LPRLGDGTNKIIKMLLDAGYGLEAIKDAISAITTTKYGWKHQKTIDETKTDLVKDEWFTAFEASGGVKISQYYGRQTNGELEGKVFEIKVTIDDAEITQELELTYDVGFWGYTQFGAEFAGWVEDPSYAVNFGAIYGHSIKIEYRITSDPGTNQSFRYGIMYEKLEVVD